MGTGGACWRRVGERWMLSIFHAVISGPGRIGTLQPDGRALVLGVSNWLSEANNGIRLATMQTLQYCYWDIGSAAEVNPQISAYCR